jgi:2'-5' RNA ligase
MRAFIGIDFDNKTKNEIYQLQQRLKRYAIKGRWKHINNFHLTLKFLDEINTTQQEQLDDVMKKVCTTRQSFSLTVTGLGTFDGKDSVRVLWLGLGGDTGHLHSLHEEIDKALAQIGFPWEKRRFRPHVTIGQDIIFECDFDQIRDAIGVIEFDLIKVNNLFLFKSEQIRNKRIYTKVTEYNLG